MLNKAEIKLFVGMSPTPSCWEPPQGGGGAATGSPQRSRADPGLAGGGQGKAAGILQTSFWSLRSKWHTQGNFRPGQTPSQLLMLGFSVKNTADGVFIATVTYLASSSLAGKVCSPGCDRGGSRLWLRVLGWCPLRPLTSEAGLFLASPDSELPSLGAQGPDNWAPGRL